MLTNEQIANAISSGQQALEAVTEATDMRFSQSETNSRWFDVKCPDGRHYGYLYSKISRANGDVVIRWRPTNAFANYLIRHRPFTHNIIDDSYDQFRDGMTEWINEIKLLLPIGE